LVTNPAAEIFSSNSIFALGIICSSMSSRVIKSVVYSAVFLVAVERCAYNDVNVAVDCAESGLAVVVVSTKNATGCKSINGEISVSATGGLAPYDFSINDGDYQTNSTFIDLGPGTFTVKVKDMNNCWASSEVTIGADGSNLSATATTTHDNQCTTDNGSITVSATGGRGPYQYQIDSQGFISSNVFTSLSDGIHVILVKDVDECQTNLSVQVGRGVTGISFATVIKPILDTNCNLSGCHGAGTGARDWTNFENVKANANNIKVRTGNKSMPPAGPLPQSQIDQIACWVDDGAPNN
jgi:hypothetical protein